MYILILKKLYIHIFKLIPVSVLILFYRDTPPTRFELRKKFILRTTKSMKLLNMYKIHKFLYEKSPDFCIKTLNLIWSIWRESNPYN